MFQLLITWGIWVFAKWTQQPRTRAKSSLFSEPFFHSLNCQSYPFTKTATTRYQRESVKLVTLSQTSKVTVLFAIFLVTQTTGDAASDDIPASVGFSSQTPSSRNYLILVKERLPGTSIPGTIITGRNAVLKSFAIGSTRISKTTQSTILTWTTTPTSIENSFEQVQTLLWFEYLDVKIHIFCNGSPLLNSLFTKRNNKGK